MKTLTRRTVQMFIERLELELFFYFFLLFFLAPSSLFSEPHTWFYPDINCSPGVSRLRALNAAAKRFKVIFTDTHLSD